MLCELGIRKPSECDRVRFDDNYPLDCGRAAAQVYTLHREQFVWSVQSPLLAGELIYVLHFIEGGESLKI